MPTKKYLYPFILVSLLFFLWAFLHNLNPILIPHLKKACELSDTQSSFIDIALYIGYFTFAIPAGLFMHKYGYKKGILFGLVFFAAGALLFIPAASFRTYSFFLFALFIFAGGATFLETCANPYVTTLGSKETSEQRLNFAQSFNGVGASLAPWLGGKFILSGIEHSKAEIESMRASGTLDQYLQSEVDTIKMPYLIMAGVVTFVGILFLLAHIPESKHENDDSHVPSKFSINVLKYSHVRWAVIAEFCYVGAQVGVTSFFIRYSKLLMDLPEKTASKWLAFAMAGFMAGRFTGTFLMRFIKPAKLLSVYAIINIGLLAIALTTKGSVAVYAVMCVPFFMSIMFPTIFALGIKDLGEETKMASSFLIMSIIGGAMAPLIMGLISDATGSIQIAYIMPLVCFAVILFFGLKGHKIKNIPI